MFRTSTPLRQPGARERLPLGGAGVQQKLQELLKLVLP